MVRIGIIGCGKIAQVRHIPEYMANPDSEIAGYYDFNFNRAQELADTYGGKVYASYQQMFSDAAIDAVSVCVANDAHEEVTVAALKAGKHVLCEKPMAMTLGACERMVDTARETGRYLMVGHNQRLIKTHVRARQLITEGAIGDLITFRTAFAHAGPETWSIDPGGNVWFFDHQKAVLGAMADLGIHKTDLIQYLTGTRIAEVMAYLGTLDKKDTHGKAIGVDANAICIYRMDNGVMGTMTASWTCYGDEDNATVLYGTEGVMKIYTEKDHSIVIESRSGERIYHDIDAIQTNAVQTESGVIDQFVNCLVTGTPPEISGEEALSAMQAVFAAVESAETGKSVKVRR